MERHAPLDAWYATARGQAFSAAIINDVTQACESVPYQSRIGWVGYVHTPLWDALAADYDMETRAIAALDDAVCSRVVAMHIFDGAEESEEVIGQAHRALEAQGELLLIARNGLCLRERCGLEKGMGLSRSAMRMLLEDAGFEDVSIAPIFARQRSPQCFMLAQFIVPHLLLVRAVKREHGATPLKVSKPTPAVDGVPAAG